MINWFLEMYRFTICYFDRIFYTFTDGWMRVDAVEHFLISCFEFSADNRLDDDFSYVITDHVRAKPLAVFRIEHHFNETFCMSGSGSFSGCAQRELANFH